MASHEKMLNDRLHQPFRREGEWRGERRLKACEERDPEAGGGGQEGNTQHARLMTTVRSRIGSNSFFSNCAGISLVLLLGRNSLIAFLAFTRFCCIREKLPNTDTNCKSGIFCSTQPILKSIRQNSSSESVFISCTHSTVFALKFYFL